MSFTSTPFAFYGSRNSILVYFIQEYSAILRPGKSYLYFEKRLEDIPEHLNDNGPFVVNGIYSSIKKTKQFPCLCDAIVYAKETDDGTYSFIRDKHDKTIAKIDAT